MGIWRRIYYSLRGKKRRSIIMVGLFGVIGVIFLYFISLYYGLELKKGNAGQGGSSYIAVRHMDMEEEYPGPVGLREESKKKIDALPGIAGIWESCAVSVWGDNFCFIGYKDRGIPLEAEESTGCLLYTSDRKEHVFFKDTGCKLVEGSFVEENGERNQAVICDGVRYMNLKDGNVGSTTTVRDLSGRVVPLKIVGITDVDGLDRVNCIFTAKETVFEAMEEPGYREVRYYLEDASKAGELIDAIDRLELPERGELQITSNLLAYKQTLTMIENSQRLLWSSLALILVLSVIILSLLYLHEFLEREKEFGILLSMGEKRRNILLQFMGEIAVPMGAAVLAAIPVTEIILIMTQKFLASGWGISGRLILDIRGVGILALCNLFIAILLIALASIVVFRQKLKRMLEKGE